jgi:hypothetical protein
LKLWNWESSECELVFFTRLKVVSGLRDEGNLPRILIEMLLDIDVLDVIGETTNKIYLPRRSLCECSTRMVIWILGNS